MIQTSTQANSVFHDGERAIHKELGIEERMFELGQRVIRDHMPDQHREFFELLPMIHISALDAQGNPHALVRIGEPGFVFAPDEHTLIIDGSPISGEPENLDISIGAKVSVVGIEFTTRRRNRLNATITKTEGCRLELRVDQSFGNCPKYIQIRETVPDERVTSDGSVKIVTKLDEICKKRVKTADTLLIASRAPKIGSDPRAGVDINHRGGNPGFLEILDDHTLQFADYRGNNFFNTFGNLRLDSRVGIQILHFETGDVLNISGQAEVITLPGDNFEFPDMGRRVKVFIETIRYTKAALPFKFKLIEFSPMLPGR